MKKLLLIKCGDTIPELVARKGDFEDWIIAGTGLDRGQTLTVNVEKDEPLPEPEEISGVIISGSHAMVTEHRPWSEKTAIWLRAAHNRVPILGICYGHQLLGYALGGRVADNPTGREMGTVEIRLTEAAADDRLFAGIETTTRAQVSHKQSLVELPPEAVLLGSSDRDPHQAFRSGDFSWGMQFHPEFDAEITTAYIEYCDELLRAENQDPKQLKQSCRDTDSGSVLLRQFTEIVKHQP